MRTESVRRDAVAGNCTKAASHAANCPAKPAHDGRPRCRKPDCITVLARDSVRIGRRYCSAHWLMESVPDRTYPTVERTRIDQFGRQLISYRGARAEDVAELLTENRNGRRIDIYAELLGMSYDTLRKFLSGKPPVEIVRHTTVSRILTALDLTHTSGQWDCLA